MKKHEFTPEELAIFNAQLECAEQAKSAIEAEQHLGYCAGMIGFALAHQAINTAVFLVMQHQISTLRAARAVNGQGQVTA